MQALLLVIHDVLAGLDHTNLSAHLDEVQGKVLQQGQQLQQCLPRLLCRMWCSLDGMLNHIPPPLASESVFIHLSYTHASQHTLHATALLRHSKGSMNAGPVHIQTAVTESTISIVCHDNTNMNNNCSAVQLMLS